MRAKVSSIQSKSLRGVNKRLATFSSFMEIPLLARLTRPKGSQRPSAARDDRVSYIQCDLAKLWAKLRSFYAPPAYLIFAPRVWVRCTRRGLTKKIYAYVYIFRKAPSRTWRVREGALRARMCALVTFKFSRVTN